MQPMLAVWARVEGLIYLNGRFAGACAADAPLFFPVAQRGANFIEYRPLARGARSLARRLVLADGRPLEAPQDVYCVLWPGGALEVELACEEEKAQTEPEHIEVEGGQLLLGSDGEGSYAAVVDARGVRTGFARFARAHLGRDGVLEGWTERNDTVGHARIERYRASGAGLEMLSSELTWARGAPDWPRNAQDTALAALEASLLGLEGEADGYLAPELRGRGLVAGLCAGAMGCGAVKYAPPGADAAVALFYARGERLAQAECVYYRCVPVGGAQGLWQIAQMWRNA